MTPQQEREAVLRFIKTYGEINFEICSDGILLDPLLRGGAWTEENVKRSDDCSVQSTIHSAKYHACQELIAAIERGQHHGGDNDEAG